MNKFGVKQAVPTVLAVVAAVFAMLGFTRFGFWDSVDGPMPGFFPGIMGTVMFFCCVLAFIQSFADEKSKKFTVDEFLIIGVTSGLIAMSYVIGLIPACLIFVLLWMKLIEKSSWKDTIIVLLVSSVIAIGVFQMWLGIQFPMGIFEQFM